MNNDLTEKIKYFLDFCFDEKIQEIKFGGESGPIEIVPYNGLTETGKVFWGTFRLGDRFSMIDWINININGKYHVFTYQPDIPESFTKL